MRASGFLVGAVTLLVLMATAFWFAQYLWCALRRRPAPVPVRTRRD